MALQLGLTDLAGGVFPGTFTTPPGLFSFTDGVDCMLDGANSYISPLMPDSDDFVVDELRLTLTGGLANIQSSIATIERTLALAREYADTDWWRVVSLYGRLVETDDFVTSRIKSGYLSRPNYDLLSGGTMQVTLYLQRENFWRYGAIAPIFTRDGVAIVGSPVIADCSDGANTGYGARRNYVDFNHSLTDIPGDLPAYVVLHLTPPTGTYFNMGRLHIFHSVGLLTTAWNSFTHHSEGSGSQTGGSTTYSGSNYVTRTLNGSYTAIGIGGSPVVYNLLCRQYAVMAVNPTIPAVALSYYLSHSSGAWQSPVKTGVIPHRLSMLDVITATPPPSLGEELYAPLWNVKTADGSSQSLVSDFFQILPMDGYVLADVITPASDQTTLITVNRPAFERPNVVALAPSSYVEKVPAVEGSGIALWPGKKNRLFFLWDRSDRTFSADDRLEIDVLNTNIYPRRRLL